MDRYIITVDKKICPESYETLYYNSEQGLVNLIKDTTVVTGKEFAEQLISDLQLIFSSPDYSHWDLMKYLSI